MQGECCRGLYMLGLNYGRAAPQGFARRYFVLYSSGLLAYSYHPEKAIRDQIFLPTAAISSTPGRKDIHVDSDRVTFHLKCLTQPDFDQWMTALRSAMSA